MEDKNRLLDAVSDAYRSFANKVMSDGVILGNRTSSDAKRFVGISTTINLSPWLMHNGEYRELIADIQATHGEEVYARLPQDFSILAASSQRKLPVKSAIAELIGFLRGYDNAEDFAKLGCKFWFKNANGTPAWLNSQYRKGDNDLGRIYGKQWTQWKTSSGGELNQVKQLIDGIINDPLDRRHIITGWRPDEMDEMCLPACHVLYQFFPNPNTGLMDLQMYQRSVDTYLGLPSNWVACSVLLGIICRFTGYKPGKLVHNGGDCHVYLNAEEQMGEIISREVEKTYPPVFCINPRIKQYTGTDFPYELMLDLQPSDIEIFAYHPGEPLAVEMVE